MLAFVIPGLLVCLLAPGSSAVTSMFLQTGQDVLLNVVKAVTLEEEDVVVWKFKENVFVVRLFHDKEPQVSPGYHGRIEFPVKKYSVKLKNVTKADSGVYTAQKIGVKIQTLDEYNVTVQDPVSPVELTVDSVSRSSDSCNLTVTCGTQDSHINSFFQCDTQTCSQEGGERSEVTTSGASLHVYPVFNFIICNHSNQVSWSKDIKMAENLCTQHAGSESVAAGFSVCQVKTVVCSISLVIMVSAIISVHIIMGLKMQKQTNAPPTDQANISHS